MSEYTGFLRGTTRPLEDRYVLSFSHGNSITRSFTGFLYNLSWEYKFQPCLYVGNKQGGAIYEVEDPNDSVIQGMYTEYIVDTLFQTSFMYGLFDESQCV